MKILMSFLIWLWPYHLFSQLKANIQSTKSDTVTSNNNSRSTAKPEILSSGFIDIVNNGQVNASARFIRLFIGEPEKFAIPLSIYSGVSSNNFQHQQIPGGSRSNDQLVANFINPLSGLANISLDAILFFNKNTGKLTRSGFMYHIGSRVLTGYNSAPLADPASGKPVNFLNNYATAGLYFQTGAWEKNNASNTGIFWLTSRYIVCKSGKGQIRKLIPGISTNGFYHGWSLAWGIEINNLVNIKVIYYNYVKAPEINYTIPIYQFSFNYSLR